MRRDARTLRTLPPTPGVFFGAGDSTAVASGRAEAGEHQAQQAGEWVGAGEEQPDAAGVAHDHGADLQELEPDSGRLRFAQLGPVQADAPDGFDEHVGRGGKQEPQLIGPPAVAAGAIGKEPELLLLDSVLHLAARAEDLVVEGLRFAWEAGHHKARVAPPVAMLGFGDHPSLAIPSVRRVIQPAKEPLLGLVVLVASGSLL